MGELEQSMSFSEFHSWQEYFSKEPLSSFKNEHQMAMLLNLLCSFMGVKNTKIEDFYLCKFEKNEKKQSKKELEALVREIFL